MRIGGPGILMAAGVVVLVAAAWMYLQDQQRPTSSAVASGAVSSPGDVSGAPVYVAQDEGAGGVKVMAAALTPGALEQDASLEPMAARFDPVTELGFMVGFETHSGDLSTLDLVALSSLSAPDGDHRAIRWVAESDSSHHRSGLLVFERGALDLSGGGDVTLTMREVAGVAVRTLTWRLPLP